MAKLKLPSFSDGSLLQRTLLYVLTFVLGSAGFIAIASLVVVSVAKSLIPARNSDTAATATEKVAEAIPAAPGKASPRKGRANKAKTPAEADAAAAEETH